MNRKVTAASLHYEGKYRVTVLVKHLYSCIIIIVYCRVGSHHCPVMHFHHGEQDIGLEQVAPTLSILVHAALGGGGGGGKKKKQR